MRSSKRFLLAATLLACLAAAALAWGLTARRETPAPAAARDAPKLGDVAPSSDSLLPEGTAAPSPAPSAPAPADPSIEFPPNQPKTGESLGQVEIPKISLVHEIFQGFELAQIDNGPGHWPGSPLPGQVGNAAFAGHRVTNSRPFYDMDKMVPGDLIIFKTPSGTFTYQMTERLIVLPTDTWILKSTPDATVTLVACHPKFSARQRIVVKGKLVSSTPPRSPLRG